MGWEVIWNINFLLLQHLQIITLDYPTNYIAPTAATIVIAFIWPPTAS